MRGGHNPQYRKRHRIGDSGSSKLTYVEFQPQGSLWTYCPVAYAGGHSSTRHRSDRNVRSPWTMAAPTSCSELDRLFEPFQTETAPWRERLWGSQSCGRPSSPIKARSRPADFGAWLGRSLPLFAMALEQAPEVDADRAKALPKARVAQTEGPARPFGHRIAGLG